MAPRDCWSSQTNRNSRPARGLATGSSSFLADFLRFFFGRSTTLGPEPDNVGTWEPLEELELELELELPRPLRLAAVELPVRLRLLRGLMEGEAAPPGRLSVSFEVFLTSTLALPALCAVERLLNTAVELLLDMGSRRTWASWFDAKSTGFFPALRCVCKKDFISVSPFHTNTFIFLFSFLCW